MLPKPVIRILRASVVRFSFIGERKYAVSPNSRWATDCLTFYKWHIMIFLGKFPWWKNPKLLQTSYVDGPLIEFLPDWSICMASTATSPKQARIDKARLMPAPAIFPWRHSFEVGLFSSVASNKKGNSRWPAASSKSGLFSLLIGCNALISVKQTSSPYRLM